LSAVGNVTGNYILGNGALLTGVITSVANINLGTSNVTVVSSNGNITMGVGGTSNVVVVATTGAYATGLLSATGNITGGNIVTGGALSVTGLTTLSSNTTVTGSILPSTGNTYDLGSTAARWRNIYTNDLQLNNGIGDYTIVEGEDDLFLYNNKKGKVYKFALVEVDPATAPPKAKTD
jgi:hypothetical protein